MTLRVEVTRRVGRDELKQQDIGAAGWGKRCRTARPVIVGRRDGPAGAAQPRRRCRRSQGSMGVEFFQLEQMVACGRRRGAVFEPCSWERKDVRPQGGNRDAVHEIDRAGFPRGAWGGSACLWGLCGRRIQTHRRVRQGAQFSQKTIAFASCILASLIWIAGSAAILARCKHPVRIRSTRPQNPHRRRGDRFACSDEVGPRTNGCQPFPPTQQPLGFRPPT